MAELRRYLPALLGLAAAGLFAVACDDALGPHRGRVHLVVQPRFARYEAMTLDGEDPALLVDNIRVVVVDEDGDTVVDRVAEWPVDQDTLRMEVGIEVTGEESFDLALQGRDGGTVLFLAQRTLHLSAEETDPAPAEAVLEYAGPESTLTGIAIQGPGTAFVAGSQVQLTAVGTTADGSEIIDPLMLWSSLDTLAASVDSAGRLRVKHDGSRTVGIVGRVAFRTLADTVLLPVVPDTMVFVQLPDTIPALGWHQIIRGIPLGADGDTVRNVEIDWAIRDESVVVQTSTYDRGIQGSMISRANGSTWAVASLGSFTDSAEVVVRQVTSAAAPMPTRAVIGVGDTVRLTIVSLDANGYPVAGAPPPVWTSAQPATASVDAGLVMGQSAPSLLAPARVTGEVQGAGYAAWIEVRDGRTIGPPTDVSVGDGHSCWIDQIRNRPQCRGAGGHGQLGDGARVDRDTTVEAVNPYRAPGDTYGRITAGGLHTCALMTTIDGTRTFCWGDNRFGQLGDGTTTARLQPTPVNEASVGAQFTDLVAGGAHTCGLTGAGAAYCWGVNDFGQLGDGSALLLSATPVPVAGGHTFRQLAAGWTHTCGLDTNGAAWCWGKGTDGQLGSGTLTAARSPVQVAGTQTYAAIFAGPANTCGITTGGGLECWGYNSAGQVGTGTRAFVVATPKAVTFPDPITVVDVALGRLHGCALGEIGAVYCWGANDRLQLGQDTPRVSRSPIPVPMSFIPSGIVGGGAETCATDGTRMICWGGVPADYLGRETMLMIPTAADPTGGALSVR